MLYVCKSLTWCLFYLSSAADTDLQEAPRTSAKVSAAPFGAARCNSPKISHGGEKFLTFSGENRYTNRPTQRQFKRV